MLLDDFSSSPDTTFKKINKHLVANYGFTISKDVTDKDLVTIMEQIEGEIVDLKITGADAKTSPEISKRLLVLEGIKSLREFAMDQFQSPDLQQVVEALSDYVTDSFRLSGTSLEDFEEAVRDAMKHYRSSKYRFPDSMIEQRIRENASGRIQQGSGLGLSVVEDENMLESDLEEGAWDQVGKRASAQGGHAMQAPDTAAGKHAMKVLDNPSLSLKSDEDDVVPMVRDKHGRMVPDPFAAQAAARRKGIVMKEQEGLVKKLRFILESKVSQAEVMMAAKGFAQELQEMIEKIGRLQNEDLPPVTDQMRETYGTDSASAFQTQIYGALQSVMDSLYTAKNQVDDAVTDMAATGQYSASIDMDKDISIDKDITVEPDGDVAMDTELDLDNIGDELADDDFVGAEEENPLGREKKMESTELKNKILEMQKLVEKARKIREAKA